MANLVKRDIETIRPNRTGACEVRKLLDEFIASGESCCEIENWETISPTIEGCRCLIRNQISYRNGRKYKNVKVKIDTLEGFHVYLIRKEVLGNGIS